ncbi:phage head closure protein (plasmid) [Pediococcus inopinatus]|uniref:phage head closure protein n=1 Tax=Pediococcus inopinatus TaxID=114090 RepID=UPI002B25D339|nr:phage head closure protein [Pediococcus inopinatus]WPC18519.1 phage head closure protein [Pediococcus inopinatus]
MQIDTSRFQLKVEFGTYGDTDKTNSFGQAIQGFQTHKTLRAFSYSQSIGQQLMLEGNGVTYDRMIGIRHNSAIKEDTLARINDVIYTITNNSVDDTNPVSYDLLTLTKGVVKHD